VRLGYVGVLSTGALFLLGAAVLAIISYVQTGQVQNAEWLAIAFLSFFLGICDYSTNLLRAQGSVVESMLPRDVLWRFFAIIIGGIFFWQGYKLSGPAALLIAASILIVLAGWQVLAVHRRMNAALQSRDIKSVWRIIAPNMAPIWATSIIIAMIQQFDVVIIGSFMSSADAGAYFAAQKTAALLSLVLIVAGLVTAPTMSALYHSHKLAELQKLCRNLAGAIALVTAIGFIILVIYGHELLALFDAHFISAYPVLIIVAIGTMIDAVSGPNAYLMQMTAYEKPYLKIMTVCYSLVLVAQIILVPRFGGVGAAAASAGGIVLWNVWAIFVLRRKAGFDPSLLSLISAPRH
jgi:O-antigen/teichoic acid export membrane protein